MKKILSAKRRRDHLQFPIKKTEACVLLNIPSHRSTPVKVHSESAFASLITKLLQGISQRPLSSLKVTELFKMIQRANMFMLITVSCMGDKNYSHSYDLKYTPRTSFLDDFQLSKNKTIVSGSNSPRL